MRKKVALEILAEYFVSKGKIMNEREYRAETDTPIRAVLVGRAVGSWNRIPRLLEVNFPDVYAILNGGQKDEEPEEGIEPILPKKVVITVPKKEEKDEDA